MSINTGLVVELKAARGMHEGKVLVTDQDAYDLVKIFNDHPFADYAMVSVAIIVDDVNGPKAINTIPKEFVVRKYFMGDNPSVRG